MGSSLPLAARPRRLTTAFASAVAIAVAVPSFANADARAGAGVVARVHAREDVAASRGWAHVAVDTSAVGEAGPAIRRRVQERADVVLRRAGVMPGRGPSDPTITVVIREVTTPDPGWEYSLSVAAERQPPSQGDTILCPLCTETELVDKIEGQLAALAATLEAPDEPPPPRVDPTPPRDDDGPVDAGPPPPERGLGTMGKAGVALLVLGGLGIIGGAVLTALPPRPKNDDPTREVFTQPPGYAMLGAGGGVLLTGVALLAVDRVRARKRSRRVDGPASSARTSGTSTARAPHR